jgi:signal transduction histidine kinase
MRLFLETLGRHDLAPERRKAFLARMEEDVERLEHTVSQVLAAARAEATARRPRGGPVDLVAVLTESIEAIRDRHGLPEEAIRLEKESSVPAAGDPAELGVVFRNLLENAVRYSEPPAQVRVRLSASGEERVQVEIADQGIGIEPRELRKIFQRFYRVGRDVQRHAAGLGLGLFIVGNLVRRQGGRVVARSEGSGRGSRFVVTLRAAVAAPSREALEAAPHLGSGG